MSHEVLHADYHRNGVGGVGFNIALVRDDKERRTFLVIDFLSDEYGHTAVVDVDQAAAGNIYMFPQNGQPGGNAWRGDRLGDRYRDSIRAALGQSDDEEA